MDGLNLSQPLISQYQASLAMLKQAVEICPEDLWLAADYRNQFWHIAYHALFYADLYLHASETEFKFWAKHQPGARLLGAPPGAPREARPVLRPYSKEELLEYQDHCCREVRSKVPAIDFRAPSGFDWLPFNRLEVQLYNIRHLQHHTGQLAERLRARGLAGISWTITGS
jgi:DinB superfamily